MCNICKPDNKTTMYLSKKEMDLYLHEQLCLKNRRPPLRITSGGYHFTDGDEEIIKPLKTWYGREV